MEPLEANTEVLNFYGWWEFSTCLFAFAALLAIWWHIGRKQGDKGQVWLAFSILCWSASGLLEVYLASYPKEISWPEGGKSLLSLMNSLFVLSALPWFRFLPKPVDAIIRSPYWMYFITIPFVLALLPTLRKILMGSEGLIQEFDVYYSLFTLVILGMVLWESFRRRRLKALAILSQVCILITLLAQLYKLSDSRLNLLLFSAFFKASLIMIFFALALSWVRELSETHLPLAENLKLRLFSNRQGDRIKKEVEVRGLPNRDRININLTPANYELLSKFVRARTKHPQGWLEVKPKNSPAKDREYDIQEYNEIRRLLINFLDELYGPKAWDKKIHFDPMKSLLFEQSKDRQRLIRLRLSPDSLKIS